MSVVSLFNTLLGTLLVASGTGTLNQYIEREFDAQMRRTARRPAATGRLKPLAVLVFGIALAAAGTIYLAARCQFTCSALAASHIADLLCSCIHSVEAKNTIVRSRGRLSRRHASPDRLGRSIWAIEWRSMDAVRDPLPVAVSSFHGNRMDVPRRLRPGRLSGFAQGRSESSFSGAPNLFAAACSCRYQHGAISDSARCHLLLRRISCSVSAFYTSGWTSCFDDRARPPGDCLRRR
jgi:hypothetical protein